MLRSLEGLDQGEGTSDPVVLFRKAGTRVSLIQDIAEPRITNAHPVTVR